MYQGVSKKNKLCGRGLDIHSGKMRDSTVQNFHQNNSGPVKAGAPSTEKDFAASLKATTKAPPSFEFYVWSDTGINLHVDLNSTPADWANKFRNEAFPSGNVYGNKSGSLWQDLSCFGEKSTQGKSSFLWNANSGQIDDQNGWTKSSSSLKLKKDGLTGLDQHDKGDSPLIYNSLSPCSLTINVADKVKENQSTVSAELIATVADNLKEDELTISAEVSYGLPNNFISGAESCAEDASKKIIDSDATDTPLIKSRCGSVGNSLSDIPDTLERQNSKPDNEILEDCALLNGSCFVNPGLVCPGASLIGSMELQSPEVASCHKYASLSPCEKDGFLDLNDPTNTLDVEQGGLVNSSEINLDTNENSFPSPTEEWEVDKIVDGRESSVYAQFDYPLKKSSLVSVDRESEMKLCKKRKLIDSEVQGSSDKPAAKFLRSMKNIAMTILPRRSMRLISK